jgi:hypothetical protein
MGLLSSRFLDAANLKNASAWVFFVARYMLNLHLLELRCEGSEMVLVAGQSTVEYACFFIDFLDNQLRIVE